MLHIIHNMYIYIYIYGIVTIIIGKKLHFLISVLKYSSFKCEIKLVAMVEGDPKAPFSIATTQGVGEGATPFPGLLHFTLDPYLIMLSV